MSSNTTVAAEPILSSAVERVLSAVSETTLQTQMRETCLLAVDALHHLTRVYLPQEDFGASAEAQRFDRHMELAPYVLSAVTRINRLLAHLAETYPAAAESQDDDDDFDFDFDLEGNDPAPVADVAPDLSPEAQVAEAATAFGGMLRSRVVKFGERIEVALAQDEGWPLLAEVDDYKHRLTKAVQGVFFGVLQVFSGDMAREELLPEYRSAVSDAITLRAALTDLTFHVGRFNEVIAGAQGDDLVPLVVGLADRLATFASRPAYRSLRAEDKKAVIDFRRTLHALRRHRKGVPVLELKRAVEGFSKFLEAMRSINQREVLMLHDRTQLEQAHRTLDGVRQLMGHGNLELARQGLAGVVDLVRTLYGRHPELDDLLREAGECDFSVGNLARDHERWSQAVNGAFVAI